MWGIVKVVSVLFWCEYKKQILKKLFIRLLTWTHQYTINQFWVVWTTIQQTPLHSNIVFYLIWLYIKHDCFLQRVVNVNSFLHFETKQCPKKRWNTAFRKVNHWLATFYSRRVPWLFNSREQMGRARAEGFNKLFPVPTTRDASWHFGAKGHWCYYRSLVESVGAKK